MDAGFDSLGEGTALSTAAASFMASIPSTGTTLDLRVLMSFDGSSEAFAFDSISIPAYPSRPRFCLAVGVRGDRRGSGQTAVFREESAGCNLNF